MNQSPCKGCGKMILWAVKEDGTKVPLDPVAPVYLARMKGNRQLLCVQWRNDCPDNEVKYYVSHFATCPKANEFSSSKRKKVTP